MNCGMKNEGMQAIRHNHSSLAPSNPYARTIENMLSLFVQAG